MKWLAFLAVALCTSVARAEAPPPLEAYGKLPTIETIKISPDGKRLAYIVTDGEARYVLISDLATRKLVLKAPAGDRKVTSAQWAGNDHVIVTVEHDALVPGLSGGKRAWEVASDIDVPKRIAHAVLRFDERDERMGVNLNTIMGRPQVRNVGGKALVFVEGEHFEAGRGALAIFKYDPATASTSLVRTGDEGTSSWLVDDDGQPLSQSVYDDSHRRWLLRSRIGGVLKTAIVQTADIERPEVVGLGRNGHATLVAIPNDAADARHDITLVELPQDQTAWSKPVAADGDEPIFDPVTEHLIGSLEMEGDGFRYSFFDPLDQKRWEGVRKAYPGSALRLQSMSGDHNSWVVEVDSATEGPAYALVDFATGKGRWLGYNYEAASKALGEKKAIAFRAADGLPLTGYLTLPRGRQAKGLPLVVFPHGGPAAHDEIGFDWWAQAMASRGYAVLQVNYRGSDGVSAAHLRAGYGEWGRKMQTDLSDGVRYLAKEGIVDPKRVCVVGASYGGYAALAGATLDSGVYRCAVSVAGVSDLRRLVRWADEEGGATAKRYWLRYMGVSALGDPKLSEISPLSHIDEVSIPILLIHGRDDTVVDFSQSQLMYDALKKQGKDVQLVVLNHEDHWLLTGATRLQMLQATMDFLQRNNPPG